jgi:hypothetical protein
VLVASLRWGAAAAKRPLGRGRALPAAVAGVVGALFAAVKLSPWVNRWVAEIAFPNVMDTSDLAALGVLAPGVFWMSRRLARRPPQPSPALRTAATGFAALACVATSKVAEPRPPRPVEPRPLNSKCAQVAPVTCRFDATRVVVRLSARRWESRDCRVRVGAMSTKGAKGDVTVALTGAETFEVGAGDAALIGASGRLGRADEKWESARVAVVHEGHLDDGPTRFHEEVAVACRPGFGEDTAPPAEVAR